MHLRARLNSHIIDIRKRREASIPAERPTLSAVWACVTDFPYPRRLYVIGYSPIEHMVIYPKTDDARV
jgi:hypothetical protein